MLTLVYDSKNDFEEIINAILFLKYGQSEETLLSDNRSDDKGAEPEGVAVGEVNGRIYAFIGLERFSGLMIYDISNPEEARFVQFVSRQNLNQELESGLAEDVSPEGVLFISAEESPNGKPLIVLGNEVSGTTTVYEISESGDEIQLIPPKAIAGPDRDDIMGKQVLLDASHSNHDNGIIVGYEWKQIGGPKVNIHNPFSPITTFDSSTIETSIEALIFQLTVSDLNALTATTEVTINLVRNMSISPVIQMLKVLANFDEPLSLYWDFNDDKKIGFEDLLFILNDVSR
jgi:hypothetical protein